MKKNLNIFLVLISILIVSCNQDTSVKKIILEYESIKTFEKTLDEYNIVVKTFNTLSGKIGETSTLNPTYDILIQEWGAQLIFKEYLELKLGIKKNYELEKICNFSEEDKKWFREKFVDIKLDPLFKKERILGEYGSYRLYKPDLKSNIPIPSLCDCLKTKGDLPEGCNKVFVNRYGTSKPSTDQMKEDYYNCN